MLIIALLLFWLPVNGTEVAGFVGEKRGPGIGSAAMAAILPAIPVGELLFALAAMMTGVAVLGPIAGMIGIFLALGLVAPPLLGALIGCIFA